MENKFSQLVKNFSVTFVANIISVLISTLVVLFLPKTMSVTGYAFWQLYILYSNYISFFHFGLADGYYLRHSGTLYENLDRKNFSFMFRFLVVMEIALALVIGGAYSLLTLNSEADPLNHFVFLMTCVSATLIIPRVFIQFAWQAGNKFKSNALIIIIERGFFLLSVALFVFQKLTNVRYLIALDLFGKLIALLIAIVWAKDMIFTQMVKFKEGIRELFANASAGLSLMLASISSNLIIGLIQLSIKDQWGTDTFGRIALTFSLSNLLMVFINALALVLLPYIRRQESSDNLRLYRQMRKTLMLFLFLLLNVYYPFRLFINFWLPKYAEGIVYMSILFPICIYESKTQLLTNTYLKAYRKEREILKANLLSLLLCLGLMLAFAYLLKDLFLTTLSILIVLAFRSFLSEIYLARETEQNYLKDNLIEIGLTVVFVLSQWFIGGWLGSILYFGFSIIYVFLNRHTLLRFYERGKDRIKRA